MFIRLITALLLVTHLSFSQKTFNPKWKQGDKVSYTIIKYNKKESKSDTLDLSLTVKKTTKEFYFIDATYLNAIYQIEEKLGEKLDLKTNKGRNLKYKLKVDQEGNIVQLLNWKQVSSELMSSFDLIKTKFEADSNMFAFNLAIAPLKSILSKESYVKGYISQEIQYILTPLICDLKNLESFEKTDSVDNPLGKGKIEAKAIYQLSTVDKKEYDLNVSSTIDAAAFKNMMADMMKKMMIGFAKMSPKNAEKTKEEIEAEVTSMVDEKLTDMQADISETAVITFNKKEKWPSKISIEKKVDFSMAGKAESKLTTITITRN